jgi:hypothetical protein
VFKDYDFGQAYNPKKLKELQLLVPYSGVPVNMAISVFADDVAVVDSTKSYAKVNENDEVVWVVEGEPNLFLPPGSVFGSWILGESPFGGVQSQVHKFPLTGKCRKVRMEVTHSEPVPSGVLGAGFIFKIKKP